MKIKEFISRFKTVEEVKAARSVLYRRQKELMAQQRSRYGNIEQQLTDMLLYVEERYGAKFSIDSRKREFTYPRFALIYLMCDRLKNAENYNCYPLISDCMAIVGRVFNRNRATIYYILDIHETMIKQDDAMYTPIYKAIKEIALEFDELQENKEKKLCSTK